MCILLVEDEALIRMLLTEELYADGFEVAEAVDGDHAARLIEHATKPFSLLLTDVQMPGAVDGVALVRMMRDAHPDVPIILTTGRPDSLCPLGPLREREKVLLKPFLPSELLREIHGLLDRPD